MRPRCTLADLFRQTGETTSATVRVQIVNLSELTTVSGKPYFDLEVADFTRTQKFKLWSDTRAFQTCKGPPGVRTGEVWDLTGDFSLNSYGLNIAAPLLTSVPHEEWNAFFQGPPGRQQALQKNWDYLCDTFAQLREPRLRAVTCRALEKFKAKWQRAAAARQFHHARRGGLLEHTAQMARCAEAVATVYPILSRDLLLAGVLFHDIGKLWENDYHPQGFTSPIHRTGELMGHICLGVEVVNHLWHESQTSDPRLFETTQPPSDLLRDHLLHLIISHHGQKEFGAPVAPRTPEAWALHQIDNLDAKLEMLRSAQEEGNEVAPGIYEIRRPLEGHPVRPWCLENSDNSELKSPTPPPPPQP